MRVAVVAPRAVPPVVGGAERFGDGLVAALRTQPGCGADLVTLPSAERSLANLVATYRAFAELDLSAYDLVISSKYPAWMVSHPVHLVYMLHRLRGVYDRYPAHAPDDDALAGDPQVSALLGELDRESAGDPLPRIFDSLERFLAGRSPDDPVVAFPGPLARRAIRRLDDIALSPARISRYFAISHGLTRRPGTFPPGVPVDVLYPPSNLAIAPRRSPEYLVTASRLDGPKRIDLLIDAMAWVPQTVQLMIAGTGPHEERLRVQAAGDPRICFTGRVTDDRLAHLYAGAIAVAFVPEDEDFGLVALEAMATGVPVVTCHDSGGPAELVIDGVHGRVVAPQARAIGEALAELVERPEEVAEMGRRAAARAARISWRRVVDRLLDDGAAAPAAPAGRGRSTAARPRIVMTSTYPVFPPRSGGQSRCFHVARELSRLADVEVVCLGGPQSRPTRREIAPGVVESVVPKSQQHDRIEARVASVMGVPVFDVLAAELIGATPRFEATLRTASRGASVAVDLNPYLHGALRRSAPRLPTVYDAHDAAFALKDQLFPRSPDGDRLRRLVRDVEGAACRDAFVVSTTWEGDARALADEYGVAIDRFVVVPNAADLDHARFVPMPSRRRAAAGWVRAAFPDQWHTISGVAVFVGSWHLPNIRAAEELLEQAGDHRDIALVLVGGHSAGLRRRVLPNTVRVLGPVSDRVLSGMLRSAHVALNPMTQGSGTNVKVVDYLAAGLPVVTTEIGARGLDLVDGEHVVVAPISAMLERAADLARDPATCGRLAVAGRRLVETRYSWPLALEPLVAAVGQLLDSPVTPRRAEPPSGARARTAR